MQVPPIALDKRVARCTEAVVRHLQLQHQQGTHIKNRNVNKKASSHPNIHVPVPFSSEFLSLHPLL